MASAKFDLIIHPKMFIFLLNNRRILLASCTGVLALTITFPKLAIAAVDLGSGVLQSIEQQTSAVWSETSPQLETATQSVLNETGIGETLNSLGGVSGITNLFNQLLSNPLQAILSILNTQLNNLLKDIQSQLGTIYGTGQNCPIIYNLTAEINCGGTTSTTGTTSTGDPSSADESTSDRGSAISTAAIQQATSKDGMGLPDPAIAEQLIRDQVLKNNTRDISGLDPVLYGQFLANESDRFTTGLNAESGLSNQAQADRKNDIIATAGVMQTITQESQTAQTKDVTQDVMKLLTLQQGQASVILGQLYSHQRLQEPVAMLSNLNLRNISRTLDQQRKQSASHSINMTQQELNLAGLNAGWYQRTKSRN
jgi:hypothetical protein